MCERPDEEVGRSGAVCINHLRVGVPIYDQLFFSDNKEHGYIWTGGT